MIHEAFEVVQEETNTFPTMSFPSPPCGIPTYKIFRSGRAFSGNPGFLQDGFPIKAFGNDIERLLRHLPDGEVS